MKIGPEATQILTNIKKSLTDLLGYGFGTTEFLIITALTLFSILFFGKLVASWIANSESGIIATFLGYLIPILAALIVKGVFDLLSPNFIPDKAWAQQVSTFLSIFTFGVAAAFITPFFLETGIMKSLVAISMTMVLTCILINLSNALINTYTKASQNFQKASSKAFPGAKQILEEGNLERWQLPNKNNKSPPAYK